MYDSYNHIVGALRTSNAVDKKRQWTRFSRSFRFAHFGRSSLLSSRRLLPIPLSLAFVWGLFRTFSIERPFAFSYHSSDFLLFCQSRYTVAEVCLNQVSFLVFVWLLSSWSFRFSLSALPSSCSFSWYVPIKDGRLQSFLVSDFPSIPTAVDSYREWAALAGEIEEARSLVMQQGGTWICSIDLGAKLTSLPADTGSDHNRAQRILRQYETERDVLVQKVYSEACDHSPTWEEEDVATELDDLWSRLSNVRSNFLCQDLRWLSFEIADSWISQVSRTSYNTARSSPSQAPTWPGWPIPASTSSWGTSHESCD